jgi:hypothetical protein
MTANQNYSITFRRCGIAFENGSKTPQACYQLQKLVNRTCVSLRDAEVIVVGAKVLQHHLDYIQSNMLPSGTLTINAE